MVQNIVEGFLPRPAGWEKTAAPVRDLADSGLDPDSDEYIMEQEDLSGLYLQEYLRLASEGVYANANVPVANEDINGHVTFRDSTLSGCRVFLGDAVEFENCTFSEGTEFVVPLGFYRGMYFASIFKDCTFSGPVYFALEGEDPMQYVLFRNCTFNDAELSGQQFWTGLSWLEDKTATGLDGEPFPEGFGEIEDEDVELWEESYTFLGCSIQGAATAVKRGVAQSLDSFTEV